MSVPKIRDQIKAILKEAGYRYPVHESRSLFMYKAMNDKRFDICVTIISLPSGTSIEFSVTFVSNRIGEAINYITSEKHRVFPTDPKTSKRWYFPSVLPAEIDATTKDVISQAECWINACSFTEKQKELSANLHVSGSGQLWHLAALAVEEDVVTLSEYLESIEKPNRGFFLPYIEKEMINRAVDFHWKYPKDCANNSSNQNSQSM